MIVARRSVALLALVALVACRRHENEAAVDAHAVARRVVSLSPSMTETMFAIGAGAALVGRSRYCDFPPEATRLPQVGGYSDPNLEAILALRPDLVVIARGPAGPQLADKLSARGVTLWYPETESLAQIDEMIRGLGERTGHAREAASVADAVKARVAGVAEQVRDLPRARVLLVFGLEPVVVAGPKSFPDEMIARAGGRNVVTQGAAYPTLGMETVLALDPDVVIDAAVAEGHGGERIAPDAPGWKELRAVKTRRVVALSDESVLRPGPRVGDALAVLARAIHGDAAKGVR